MRKPFIKTTLLLLGSTAIFGCSGSSDDSGSTAASASVSGTVFASATADASVTIEDLLGNRLAGPVTTDANGAFSLNIAEAELSGDLVMKSSGGTFIDEAMGSSQSAGEMSAYIDANSVVTGGSVNLTPGTTIISEMIAAGVTVSDARAYFEQAFAYQPDSEVAPVDVTDSGNSSAEQARLLAGLRAAAFSQLAHDTGHDQFELLMALARDLSDGALDGQVNGSPVAVGSSGSNVPSDIQARFADSFTAFFGSDRNHSALDNNQIGQLPQLALVNTASYSVRYSAGSDGTTMGKDSFQLEIRDHDGNPVSGRHISIQPHMNMASGHAHSTAVGHVIESSETAGTYDADIYYVMASLMADGGTMGWWQLHVCIADAPMVMSMAMDMGADSAADCSGGERATFYPSVAMAMGVKGVLKGVDDVIPDMLLGGNMPRNYHIFKDSIEQDAGSFHAHVYIAATETMHNFPGLTPGLMLNDGTEYALMANTVEVQFSADSGATWVAATNTHGGGVWAASMTGMADKLWVKLSVNGEAKTDNGLIDGFDYIELTVGGMSDMGSM